MKTKLLIPLVLLLLVGGTGLFFLFQKRDLGTEVLRTKLYKTVETWTNSEVKAEKVSGNPLIGFMLTNMDLVSEDGASIIEIPKVRLELDIISVLKGKPRVKALSIAGGRFDLPKFAELLGCYDRKDQNPATIPSRITLENCSFMYKGSTVMANDLSLRLKKDGLESGKGTGSFNGMDFGISFAISLDGPKLNIQRTDLSMEGTTLSLTGTIEKDALQIDGRMATDDFSFISNFVHRTKGARMSGGLSAGFTITGTPFDPVIGGKLEVDRFSVARFRFDRGKSDWHYEDHTISFANIAAHVFGSPVSGDLDVTFTQGPLELSLDLKGKDLNVEDWTVPLPWLTFASGRIDSMDVDLKGPYRNFNGGVKLKTSRDTLIKGNPFSRLAVDIDMEDGKHLHIGGEGLWHGTDVKSEGTMELQKTASRMDITFKTRNLDMHRLKGTYPMVRKLGLQGTVAAEAKLEGTTKSPEFTGSLTSDKVKFQGLDLHDMGLSFHSIGDETKLGKIHFKWREASFHGKGTVKGLTGKEASGSFSLASPSLKIFDYLVLKKMSASASFEKDALHIESLKAALADGNFSIAGPLDLDGETPVMNIKGKSSKMKASELMSQLDIPLSAEGNMDASFSMIGPCSAPELSTTLTSPNLDINGLPVKSLRASVKVRDGKLFIKGLKADLRGSPLKSSGTVSLGNGEGRTLDVRTTVDSLDLSSITGISFPDLPASGSISADMEIKGNIGSPQFIVNASAGRFSLAGLSFNGLDFETLPTEKDGTAALFMLKAYMGDSPLEITGAASLSEDSGPEISFKGRGKGLDAEGVSGNIKGSMGHPICGTFDFDCNGKISGGRVTGEGRISSPEMTMFGYRMNQVDIPFSFDNDMLKSEKGTAMFYGGTCMIQGSMDPEKAKWKMNLHLENADLARFSRDFNVLGAVTTGKADLQMDLSGVFGKIYLLSGTGAMVVQDGTVGGFNALKSLTKDGILTYKNLNASFNLDGGNVYFLPGSRVSAYPEDNLYKYLSFSGAMGGPNTNMDLKCSGRISIKVLSALQGVIQAIEKSENGDDRSVLLQDFLSGLVGGYSGPDFRNMNFELAGTWKKPTLYSLKVESRQKSASSIPEDDDEGSSGENKIKFKVTIPTGEGTQNSSTTGDQFKQQIMENILKQIFIDEDNDKGD